MNLKGIAIEHFNTFYLKLIREQRQDYNKFTDRQVLAKFYRKIDSEKYGVLVDWFDSVGIEILISKDYDYENNIDINAYIFHIDNHESNDFKSYPTRTQARQKAIERANTIYNERD